MVRGSSGRSFSAALLLLTAAFSGAAALGLVTLQTGCSGQACSIDPFHPEQAVATIECPAGLLCYQGQCIRGCNAGSEDSLGCGADSECDSSRPYCVRLFCSACPEGDACVPTLNICRRVERSSESEMPMRPDPNAEKPPYPLVDAGFEAEGLQPGQLDAGIITGPPIPLSRVGFLELAQIVELQTSPSSAGSVTLQIWNVENTLVQGFDRWRAEFNPPLAQAREPLLSIVQPNRCEVRRLETSSAAVSIEQADLGPILIGTHPDFSAGSSVELKASFDAGLQQYVLDMPVPASLLQYSVFLPSAPAYLAVTGVGLTDVTDSSWPDFPPGQTYLHHVPFELRLTPETESLLRAGVDVGAAPIDLALRFVPFNPNGTITGVIRGEHVALSVVANNIELYCEVEEDASADNTLFVQNSILAKFRSEVGASGTFPLSFERAHKSRPPIDPAPGHAIDLIVNVSHKYRSVLRLQ